MRKEDLNKEQLIGALGASENLCNCLKKENDELRKRLEKLESGICGSGVMIPVEYHTCDGKLWCNTGAFDEVLCRLYKANERINDLEQKRVERGIETFKGIEAIQKINDELKAENDALKQRIKDLEYAFKIAYKPESAESVMRKTGLFSEEFIQESMRMNEAIEKDVRKEIFKNENDVDKDKLISELQDQHQQDCIKINQLNVTIGTLVDKYSRLRKTVGMD